MKKIFCLLCLLTCVGASYAATMCVPDLSTCDSCTDAAYDGMQWTATCCGVFVSGIAMGIQFREGLSGGYAFKLSDPIVFDEAGGGSSVGNCGCIVLHPVASVGVHVKYGMFLLDLGYANCAQYCAENVTSVLDTLSKDNINTFIDNSGYEGGQ